jgi:hypothetical protein
MGMKSVDLPGAAHLVLAAGAEILGLHIHAAERWSKLAKRDWAGYLEACARDLG